MSKTQSFYDTVDQVVTYGIQKNILHLYTSEAPFEGNRIILEGREVLNFGSCRDLGLEFDERLKAGARKAIEKYGTQFSESRAYVSLGSYKQLESLLEEIFGAFCVVTPTTTLGHIANIPVVVEDEDAVILDQQVHNSVQMAVQLVKARGVPIELLRHNRMDLLEERIKELRQKHPKVWYMADGIYSMFGDATPVDIIYQFLDRYPEFYFYVDDAHGMSIHGPNGRGYVLSKRPIHRKMMMATSLNKAFACGGGLLVYGDKEWARKVGTVGGPLLSSGPMQPSAVGAAIACARIHLSGEIKAMQERLQDNIRFCTLMLKKYRLPVVSQAGAAIFFVGVSLPKLGHNLVRKMLDEGYYVNLGVFPTVPMKRTGIRFTITRLHTFKEIENMVSTMARLFPVAMKEENVTLSEIYKAFKLPVPPQTLQREEAAPATMGSLREQHFSGIREIGKETWNRLFEGKGSFDYDALVLLEHAFAGHREPENNWLFDYILVRDTEGQIVAATFFTTALWKDDMLSHGDISAQVEEKRKRDPYYLTGRVVCAGSLLTEGEHLYLDFRSSWWKQALQLVFKRAYQLQESYEANHIVLRDFHGDDPQLEHLMADNGFFKTNMPDSFVIPSLNWANAQAYYQSLSGNSKRHLRKKVFRHLNRFKVSVIADGVSRKEMDYWYRLYLNVKKRSLELNTFALPRSFFEGVAVTKNWEVIHLTIDGVYLEGQACCVVFCYKSAEAYVPVIIGMDYTFNAQFEVYRQALYQVVLRARALGKKKVFLGFSAGIEKKKLGAMAVPTFAYMHIRDSYDLEVLGTLSVAGRQTK